MKYLQALLSRPGAPSKICEASGESPTKPTKLDTQEVSSVLAVSPRGPEKNAGAGQAPAEPVAPAEGVLARPTGPTSAPISAYVATLGALWALGVEGPDADRTEIGRLLGEVARLTDDLGAEVALTVSRHAARAWSAREGRCAYCGTWSVFHDPDTGEDAPLGPPQ